MTTRKKKVEIIIDEEESVPEDWCFVCKDGGDLILCDYGDCLKVYHTFCVQKDGSCSEIEDDWTCDRHVCFRCGKTPPSFFCFCCPNSVCEDCFRYAKFLAVRDDNGFCDECLDLVLLGEEKDPRDSKGNVIDFKDRNTQEGLFKEYWDIIKEKEGLTVDDVHYAIEKKEKKKNKNKKKKNKKIHKCDLSSGKLSDDDEDCVLLSDDEDDEDERESHEARRKRKGLEHKREYTESHKRSHKKKTKAQGLEFCGWASKPLIEFLNSIGKDTTEPLSLDQVDRIIKKYVQDKNLFDREKKRQVRCDEALFSVFRKRKFKRSRIYYLLESHFVENRTDENLEEHDPVVDDEMEDESIDEKSEAETEIMPRLTGFASIVDENVKLVYLRKSLVEELLKLEPENFQEKVVGSFIKIKSEAKDHLHYNCHQILPVTGVVESSPGNILLEVSSMQKPVRVDMLLDSDLTEKEILDLQEKIENGVLKKLPTVELEKKARSLHEDITKHWIKRELRLLQLRIDYSNEKGRRRELYDYVEKREELERPWYQKKLLQTMPRVIPEYEVEEIDQ